MLFLNLLLLAQPLTLMLRVYKILLIIINQITFHVCILKYSGKYIILNNIFFKNIINLSHKFINILYLNTLQTISQKIGYAT